MSLNVHDVICRALRLLGSVASGDEPDAEQMADAMTGFNTLKRSWYGTLIGARLTEQAVAASPAQAENGGEYAVSALTLTLNAPGSPRAGARFGVVDAALAFAAHNCTVSPNGYQIEGSTAPLVLSVAGDNRRWWFRGDTGNWVSEADFTDPTNAIEFPDAMIAFMPYMLAIVLAPEFNTEIRQDVIAADALGRAAMARAYAPRGRNEVEAPLGVPWPAPAVNVAQ
jgi:hypothetical protein